jgi:tetratricopeptide (TPR) repeat protein
LPSHRLAPLAILSVASAVLVVSFAGTPAAKTTENLSIATPFEVGDSPAGNYLAAVVAGADRDTVAAATFFREALRFDPNNKDLLERAFVAAMSDGSMAESFSLAERLLALEPDNGLAHLAMGVRDLKEHQYSSARWHFSRDGGNEGGDLTATLLSAWAYQGSGQTRKALDVVGRLDDQNFAIFRDYHQALIADVAGRKEQAAQSFQAAYNADKTTLRLIDAYARFLSETGKNDQAIAVYNTFSQSVPDHPAVRQALADLKNGKTLTPLVKNVDEGAAEVLYGLGAAGERQGDDLAGMIYLRLSLFLKPDNALALLTLGDLYEHINQNEQALDIYQDVPENDALRETADIEISQVLENLGRRDQALSHLRDVVNDHPYDEEALSALGNLQRAHNQFDEAIASYTRAIAASKKPENDNWPLYYFRGIAYERSKDWPKAEADFKHALQLFPDQPLVLNYLGYSWVDKGMNLDQAFPMLRRAVELRPTDGYIVDSLGWAEYKLGHYQQAVSDLEKAIDLKPADPTINEHLGDAYWRVGDKLDAHFQWNHARDMGPDPADLPRILKKIKFGLDAVPEKASEAKPVTDEKPAAADAEHKQNGG